MGTHKSSSTGKSAKANHKNSAKDSKDHRHQGSSKDKHAKPVSKFSSIKQALFGGTASKKGAAPAPKSVKKENSKPAAPAKATKAHAKEAAHHPKERHKEAAHGHAAKKGASEGHSHKKKAAQESAARSAAAAGGRLAHARGAVVDTGEAVCREVACEGLATSAGYCRLHYIKNWKKIKRKEVILKEGKLNQYIEELVAKYPDKYIEAIRQDLANDKDFAKVIYDLDLDESLDDFDVDAESSDNIIDSIKRDFDDEGDTGF